MPAKNTRRMFVAGGYYHIYNRGVNKRTIFKDVQDKKVFLGYLKEGLMDPADQDYPKPTKIDFTLKGQTFKGVRRQVNSYYKIIELIAYCLMSNHFHLLIRQLNDNSISEFVRSLLTRYTMYFNRKYGRTGRLFQGVYRACLINDEQYLLWLSRYIHRNPAKEYKDLSKTYSSYADYLGARNTKWLRPDVVLGYFKNQDYRAFVEGKDDRDGELSERFALE